MTDTSTNGVAVVFYGNGGDLGNFQFFADDLVKTDISARYTAPNIIVKRTGDREQFFQSLLALPERRVIEMHVFSHSIGAGLYVGYEDQNMEQLRIQTAQKYANEYDPEKKEFKKFPKVKIPFDVVLRTEVEGVLTDHLITPPWSQYRDKIRTKFLPGATLKLWGCNAGVTNHRYRDVLVLPDGRTQDVFDQDAPADGYYWRALNSRNTPKPSIAQALADYLGIEVFGATTGAHAEVRYHDHWITSQQYKDITKHWPGKPQILRLAPINGGYYAAFNPR